MKLDNQVSLYYTINTKECWGNLLGVEVYEIDESLTKYRKQVRFPKSKKRRIRKKWSKNERNFESGKRSYMVGNRLYADNQTIIALRDL